MSSILADHYSALVYELKCGGMGGCRVSANEYSCPHGVQIKSGDLTPYLPYDIVTATQREKRFSERKKSAVLTTEERGFLGPIFFHVLKEKKC